MGNISSKIRLIRNIAVLTEYSEYKSGNEERINNMKPGWKECFLPTERGSRYSDGSLRF
jgi:hypothetical protein